MVVEAMFLIQQLGLLFELKTELIQMDCRNVNYFKAASYSQC